MGNHKKAVLIYNYIRTAFHLERTIGTYHVMYRRSYI
jgi:hypothetical protein